MQHILVSQYARYDVWGIIVNMMPCCSRKEGESAEGERQADSLLDPRNISAAVREHLYVSFRKVTP